MRCIILYIIHHQDSRYQSVAEIQTRILSLRHIKQQCQQHACLDTLQEDKESASKWKQELANMGVVRPLRAASDGAETAQHRRKQSATHFDQCWTISLLLTFTAWLRIPLSAAKINTPGTRSLLRRRLRVLNCLIVFVFVCLRLHMRSNILAPERLLGLSD